MRTPSTKTLHEIELLFPKEVVRTVKVRAADRSIAERKALKRNPGALGIAPALKEVG